MGSLQEAVGIAASTLAHHLHRLVLTGLVTQERQATTLICRANYTAMNGLILADECCADDACVLSTGEAAVCLRLFVRRSFSQPRLELGQDRPAPFLAQRTTCVCRLASDVFLDVAEFGDAPSCSLEIGTGPAAASS